jgi:glycosyltransferase involved in cell wall biosynthesis
VKEKWRLSGLATPGIKVVVGDGPERKLYENGHPAVPFTAICARTPYAHAMSSADVFVFPSLTDTLALVMIEATACGTPVAAFNVASPIDVVESGVTGELIKTFPLPLPAPSLDRDGVRRGAAKFTWERVAEMFEQWLVPLDVGR